MLFIHDLAFWFCSFFLLGVLLISISGQFTIVLIIASLAFLYLIIFKKYYFAIFAPVILIGALYYLVFDAAQSKVNIPFDIRASLIGVVRKLEQTSTSQELVVSLRSPYFGIVKINTRPYPGFNYGDEIKITGTVKEPLPEFRDYYKKEGIAGNINFPELELLGSGRGSRIKSALFELKSGITQTFKRNLPSQKAAFLAGITLGERQEFSKEFQEKLSLSGTTHIVALSGYNVSVIALAVGGIFGLYFSRSITFYLSVIFILLFVLMTGGEASIIRAAVMGIIMLLAKESERFFSIRNAIIIAAFLMVIFNPRILVFDLGFQLSFAALLGIVYVMPVLQKALKIKDPGFLDWKENAVATLSAQLAVAPILLGNFGIFSLTSLLANILILSAIPLTMTLGFIMGGLGFMSEFLVQVISFGANALLTYELWIINLFSKLTLPIAAESFGFLAAAIYYLILIGIVAIPNYECIRINE